MKPALPLAALLAGSSHSARSRPRPPVQRQAKARTHLVAHLRRPAARATGVAGPLRPGTGSKPGVGSGAGSPPARPRATTKPR